MKNKLNLFLAGVLGLLLAVIPAQAQTALTTTALAEAVDGSETVIDIDSATGIVANDIVFVDREAMKVISVDTTNNRITVQRGVAGTSTASHADNSVIWHEVPAGLTGSTRSGSCTDGSEFPDFEPLIHPVSGKFYTCTNSVWVEHEVLPQVAYGAGEAADHSILFDGNAQDFTIGLDDSADDLGIYLGSVVGTTPILTFDEDRVITPAVGMLLVNEDTTAANTLAASECGKVVFLNSATEFATTLPAPSAGCYFRFIVKAAPSGASYTVVTNASANILIGGVNELEVDTADDGPYDNNGDTVTFVDGVSVVGDYVEVFSDGTSWYLTGQANADGGITVTGT